MLIEKTCMNSLSKFDLMRLGNKMLLYPQKLRFYFHSPFVCPTFQVFRPTTLYFFLFFYWREKESIEMFSDSLPANRVGYVR